MEVNRDLSNLIWNNPHIDDMQKARIMPLVRWKEEAIAQLKAENERYDKRCQLLEGTRNTLELDVGSLLEIRGTFENQPTRHMLRLIAEDLLGDHTSSSVKRARANWLRAFATALGGEH